MRDEAAGIDACLAALDAAAARCGLPVTLLAFANGCTDDSLARIKAFRARHMAVDWRAASLIEGYRHAGWARRLAMDAAAAHLGDGRDLLLSTDADSAVAPDWLARTVAHVDAGCDAVAGLALTRRAERAEIGERAWRRMNALGKYGAALCYLRDSDEPRPHHAFEGGASIALTLAMYRAIGGAPTPAVGEDRALFAAVRKAGGRIKHAIDVKVFTSCRLEGRAPGGMAATLRGWVDQDENAPLHETYSVEASLRPEICADDRPISFAQLPQEMALAREMIRSRRAAP